MLLLLILYNSTSHSWALPQWQPQIHPLIIPGLIKHSSQAGQGLGVGQGGHLGHSGQGFGVGHVGHGGHGGGVGQVGHGGQDGQCGDAGAGGVGGHRR
ncbi:hypothetical protein, partial [Anaerosporobacter sp.]